MRSPLEGDTAARPCPVCGTADRTPAGVRADGAALHECATCRLVYVSPAPTADALSRFYASYWGPFRAPQRPTRASVDAAVDRGDFDHVEQFLVATVGGVPRSLCDIGAGSGGRLARFRARGTARVAGCEPDATASNWARDALGLEVVTGTAAALGEREGFDVVLLSEVIEHVLDPVGLLREAAARLAPTGVLVVTTPNAGVRLRARGEWAALATDFDHLAYFDAVSMPAALERAGLRARELFAWGRPSRSSEVRPGNSRPAASRLTRAQRIAARVAASLRTPRTVLDTNEGYHLLCSAARRDAAPAPGQDWRA